MNCVHTELEVGEDNDYFCKACQQRFNMMITLRLDIDNDKVADETLERNDKHADKDRTEVQI